jgi:hypothetical protein
VIASEMRMTENECKKMKSTTTTTTTTTTTKTKTNQTKNQSNNQSIPSATNYSVPYQMLHLIHIRAQVRLIRLRSFLANGQSHWGLFQALQFAGVERKHAESSQRNLRKSFETR